MVRIGVALAVGELAALWLGDRVPAPALVPWLLALILLAVGLLRWWCGAERAVTEVTSRHRGGGRRGRGGSAGGGVVSGCIAAALLAGLALGISAGGSSEASCTAALSTGDRVAAVGVPEAPEAPVKDAGGRSRGVSTRYLYLRGVELRRGGRVCRLPRLAVRLRGEPPGAAGARGIEWSLDGVWRRTGAPEDGWPRSPVRYGYLYASGAGVKDATGQAPAARDGRARLQRALRSFRERAGSRLRRLLPRDVEGIAVAMVLAERGDVDPGVSRRFAESGLAHLLAISGLHVGILAALAASLFGLLVSFRFRLPLAAGVVLGYVTAIGAPPAALRAGLLFAAYATARLQGSPRRLSDMVGLAAIVALLIEPIHLLEASFQLSFAGFVGVVAGARAGDRLTGPRGGRLARRGPGWRAARWLAASTGAFLFTAPFSAMHFQRSAPIAVASSMVGTPLVGLILPALVGALLLPGPLATLSAGAATALVRFLYRAVSLFAALPFGHGAIAPPRAHHWIAFLLLALALAAAAHGLRGRALLRAGAALALLVAGPGLSGLPLRGMTLLCTLSVGQGDAAVVRTRRGNWIVLDVGPGGGRSDPVVRFLRAHGARGVELFSLSHPHLDHMGGATELFDAFRVRRVLDAGNPLASSRYGEFLDAVEAEGAEWLRARTGTRLRLDEIRIAVLGPDDWQADDGADSFLEANEASLAMRIGVHEHFAYINTGDASRAEEDAMLARWPPDFLRAQVLKLGHHGSRTSSGLPWLRATRPEVAIISAGIGNRYGHPHPETLARLDSAGPIRVWRTDRQGTLCIQVERDGAWRLRDP